jgi:site-specific DNA-methyltransferase (adenine-specific)
MIKNNTINLMNSIDGMDQMDLSSVDLTVTSPPYDDLRTYNDSSKWDFDQFKLVAQSLMRVTKKGGVVVWVVGDAVIRKSESCSSFKQALYFVELGFKLHDTMIYEKNGAAFPARASGNRYSQVFEYMFVLSKEQQPKTANLICDKPNKWAGHTNWGQSTFRDKDGNKVNRTQKPTPDFSPRNNIWKYNTGKGFHTKDSFAFDHPAMFPESLAEDHIKTWSNKNDLILDPFAGAGTTLKMAALNDRQFIGFEIDPEYFEIAKKRISFLKFFS